LAGHSEDNVFLIGDVDDDSEKLAIPLAQQIAEQSKLKNGRIDLWINSYGGYTHIAMHIIELMEAAKRQGVVVRTIVPGLALSAGSLLAIAGTPGERYIAPKAEHLIHYGQVGSLDQTPQQVDRSKDYKKRAFKAIVDHYKHYSNVPDLEAKISDDGYFVHSRDCIRWGLADKTTDKLKLEL